MQGVGPPHRWRPGTPLTGPLARVCFAPPRVLPEGWWRAGNTLRAPAVPRASDVCLCFCVVCAGELGPPAGADNPQKARLLSTPKGQLLTLQVALHAADVSNVRARSCVPPPPSTPYTRTTIQQVSAPCSKCNCTPPPATVPNAYGICSRMCSRTLCGVGVRLCSRQNAGVCTCSGPTDY